MRAVGTRGGVDSGKDYYGALGVSSGASDADIKKAFHRLAVKYHPDTRDPSVSADEARRRFIEVSEAYQVLRERRSEYDLARRGARSYPPSREQVTWDDYRRYQGSTTTSTNRSTAQSSSNAEFPHFFSDAEFMRWYAAEFQTLFREAQNFVQEEAKRRPHFQGGFSTFKVEIDSGFGGRRQRIKIKSYGSGGPGGWGYSHHHRHGYDPERVERMQRLATGVLGLLRKVVVDVLSGAGPLGKGIRTLLSRSGYFPELLSGSTSSNESAQQAHDFGEAMGRERSKPRDVPPSLSPPAYPAEYQVGDLEAETGARPVISGKDIVAYVIPVQPQLSWLLSDRTGTYRVAELALASPSTGVAGTPGSLLGEVTSAGGRLLASAVWKASGGLLRRKDEIQVRDGHRLPWLALSVSHGLTAYSAEVVHDLTGARLGSGSRPRKSPGEWSFQWEEEAMRAFSSADLAAIQQSSLLLLQPI